MIYLSNLKNIYYENFHKQFTRNHGPPLWTCWIIYPLTLAVMVSQEQTLKWIDTIWK